MPRPWAYTDNIEETPFLKLLADYMYSQRPPLTAAQLAYKTRIPSTTIIGWFREGRVPQPRTLQRIAAGTTIPLADLFTACGYPLPPAQPAVPTPEDSFEAVVEGIRRDPWFSPETKEALIARVREVQHGAPSPAERYIAQEMVVEGSTSPSTPAIEPPAPTSPPSPAVKRTGHPTHHQRRTPTHSR